MIGNVLVSGFVLESLCEACPVLKQGTDAVLFSSACLFLQSESLIFINFSQVRVTNHWFLQQKLRFSVYFCHIENG